MRTARFVLEDERHNRLATITDSGRGLIECDECDHTAPAPSETAAVNRAIEHVEQEHP